MKRQALFHARGEKGMVEHNAQMEQDLCGVYWCDRQERKAPRCCGSRLAALSIPLEDLEFQLQAELGPDWEEPYFAIFDCFS